MKIFTYRGDNKGMKIKGVDGEYATSEGHCYKWKLTVCDCFDRCSSDTIKLKFKKVKKPKSECYM